MFLSVRNQHLVSKLCNLPVEMPQKIGEASSSSTGVLQKLENQVTNSNFVLSDTNYRLWAMIMEFYLEAHGLWEVIGGDDENRTKDRLALSAILSSILESASFQMDIKLSAKENWESLKILQVRADHVIQSRIQFLRRELENLSMRKEEKVSDYSLRFTKVISELRDLGEKLDEKDVVSKLLRSLQQNFDTLTLSLEHIGTIKPMTIEEVLGSMRVYESRLIERDNREEEQALLSKASKMTKKFDRGQTSRGRGRIGQRGRGRGRGRGRQKKAENDEGEKKPFDKSKIKCYNCQKMGHFADECHDEIKKKGNYEKANLVEESEEESALMILFDSEFSERLFQGGGDDVNCDLWYLDTGASSHMTGIKSIFHSINKDETWNVNFGDGSSIKYEGHGTIIVIYKNDEEIELQGVLYLPKLKRNILCLGKLDDQGCKTSLSGGYLTIRDKKEKLLTKTKKTRGNMYQIKLAISESCNLSREDEAWLWHGRFCHQSFHTLDSMIKEELVRGLPVFEKPKELCSTCISGKHTKCSFKASIFRAKNPLDLVHMDLCGPIRPPTLGGKSYFLLIVDDFSRYMWIYLLSYKAEALQSFKRFKVMAETEIKGKLRCARSDRGGEFLSKEFNLYCKENGILRQLTAPHTP